MTRSNVASYLFVTLLIASACGPGEDNSSTPRPRDAGIDVMVADDVAAADDGTDGEGLPPPVDMPPPEDMAAPETLCSPCTDDAECGGPDDRCIGLFNEESVCGRVCDESAPCPEDYFCAIVDQATMEQQCVPQMLTCIDRCTDVLCSGNDVCDPLTGECNRPLRLCETDCLLSETCGDGPEDICLNMPNTPDGERACLTGCDPESETSQCPPDYFCVNTSEDDPNAGVCFPFQGTCVDRCSDVDCPIGENCSPVTGLCEPAQFGACETGCTTHAQCGGQNDLCIDLGINDGAHCWQSCVETPCPSGYECRGLLGTTLRLCIPLGNDCSACEDNACFPDGVCDPVADTCEELPPTCNTDAECDAGSLCDPVSSTCVEIGRPCRGSSWATDCDNAVTKCTTQKADTEGRCEQMCATDADCITGTCTDTTIGQFCLTDDFGGAATCGTLYSTMSADVGRPCAPGSCRSPSPQCIDDGTIDGFCSQSCVPGGGTCPSGTRCGEAVDGSTACIPANCECAGSSGLSAFSQTVWGALGASQCDIHFEPRRYDAVEELSEILLSTSTDDFGIERRIRYPFASLGQLEADVAGLDLSTDPVEHLRAVGELGGVVDATSAPTFDYPGTEGAIAQATASLITAAGGTPDLSALDGATQSIPTAVHDAVAPLISSAALGLERRELAAQSVWGAANVLPTLFADAPYLLLPGTAAQEAAAQNLLDPANPVTLEEAHEFSRLLMAEIQGSFGAVGPAIQASSALATTSFGTVILDTPAGKVVIADHTDQTHDEATLGTEIAVLVDLGGDDTYRIAAGANASVANGVSLLVDLGGSDDYGYEVVPDPDDDPALLGSDVFGRITPTLPLNQANGPVSASDLARQGAGRLGYGFLFDVGAGVDTYASLRMSQGASVFGVGVLWDDGPATFESEALSQGAALGGLASLRLEGSHANSYRTWHAGQAFASAGGVAVALDRGGDDVWLAEPGATGSVLYLSSIDRGVSNQNLAQGVGFGREGEFQGGIALLRDLAGSDDYTVGTFGQGYGRAIGVGVVADGSGNDVIEGRGLVQGVGEWRGAGIFRDDAGDDVYNATTARRLVGQGAGQTLGWGAFLDLGGVDAVTYLPSGGGVGIDGGLGIAVNDGGDDTHTVSSDASWGFAQISAQSGEPGYSEQTVGLFVDAGGGADTYTRPSIAGVGDDQTWTPMTTDPTAFGAGIDH